MFAGPMPWRVRHPCNTILPFKNVSIVLQGKFSSIEEWKKTDPAWQYSLLSYFYCEGVESENFNRDIPTTSEEGKITSVQIYKGINAADDNVAMHTTTIYMNNHFCCYIKPTDKRSC